MASQCKINSKYEDLYLIKTNRIFNITRKFAWIMVAVIAGGGLFYPKLGLLLVPIMIALMGLGFFKGKYWCGNICPHGSLFDYIIMPLSRNSKIPKFFKSKIFVIAAFTWFMVMLGLRLKKVFTIFGSSSFIDKLGYIFVMNYLIVTIGGIVLAIFFTPRTWCSFCPMGTMEKLMYKLGKKTKLNEGTDKKITIEHKDKCHLCGKCARVCPMQLTPYTEFSDNNQLDAEDCIRCETCVENCPANILTASNKREAVEINSNTNLNGYEKRQKVKAEIIQINELLDDTIEYTFKLTDDKHMHYEAGQFVLVKIQNDPEMYRAYSISSANEDKSTVSITIKKVDKGYGTSIIFDTFKKGDIVELDGPMGNELLLDKNADNVLLVAGGIGVTPFVPAVKTAIENGSKNIKLIHGVNEEKDFLYKDYFGEMSSVNNHFQYIQIAASDDNWKGKKGFVTDALKEMDLEDYKIYVCGSKPMLNAVLKTLKHREVKDENVFYETA